MEELIVLGESAIVVGCSILLALGVLCGLTWARFRMFIFCGLLWVGAASPGQTELDAEMMHYLLDYFDSSGHILAQLQLQTTRLNTLTNQAERAIAEAIEGTFWLQEIAGGTSSMHAELEDIRSASQSSEEILDAINSFGVRQHSDSNPWIVRDADRSSLEQFIFDQIENIRGGQSLGGIQAAISGLQQGGGIQGDGSTNFLHGTWLRPDHETDMNDADAHQDADEILSSQDEAEEWTSTDPETAFEEDEKIDEIEEVIDDQEHELTDQLVVADIELGKIGGGVFASMNTLKDTLSGIQGDDWKQLTIISADTWTFSGVGFPSSDFSIDFELGWGSKIGALIRFVAACAHSTWGVMVSYLLIRGVLRY